MPDHVALREANRPIRHDGRPRPDLNCATLAFIALTLTRRPEDRRGTIHRRRHAIRY